MCLLRGDQRPPSNPRSIAASSSGARAMVGLARRPWRRFATRFGDSLAEPSIQGKTLKSVPWFVPGSLSTEVSGHSEQCLRRFRRFCIERCSLVRSEMPPALAAPSSSGGSSAYNRSLGAQIPLWIGGDIETAGVTIGVTVKFIREIYATEQRVIDAFR